MDNKIMEECITRALAGEISFPETVMKLAANGVERYIADLVGLKIFYYSTQGETHISPLAFKASEVAAQFDAVAVKNTIAQIQQGNINYQEFLRMVIAAGCSHYEVYITGKKVIYFGRDGSQHIELFPQPKN